MKGGNIPKCERYAYINTKEYGISNNSSQHHRQPHGGILQPFPREEGWSDPIGVR
jgi:hypothetical protein